MCGNIKKLRYPDREATQEELEKAALQYIRKISNYRNPSAQNKKAFEKAINKIAKSSAKMLANLQ